MVARIVKISAISTPKVGYYSVILGSKSHTEFDEFNSNDFSDHIPELSRLLVVIEEMGLTGAKPYYFKEEGGFQYLPNIDLKTIECSDTDDYGIRLYSYVLSPQIVFLFNGGIKTQLNPEKCPNVSTHFKRAKKLAGKLKYGVENNFITHSRTNLNIDEGFEIDI